MKNTFVRGNYFYGNEVSEHGKNNGYVDYATLAKSFDAVCNNDIMSRTDGIIGYWELENGDYNYYEDCNGNKYSESERDEAIEELTEQIEELETDEAETEEIEALKEQLEELENAEYYSDDVYQWYIISDNGAEILKEWTDELVWYNSELDIYLWGVTHWGTSWDYVCTNIRCNVKD